tara:strand:- start:111 stop:551 length:441 start_codon:yes stop_codon:yes gene_type:complete
MIIKVNNDAGLERFKREVIKNKKSCFAMFHMEGCGHCVLLRPEWEKMKNKVKSFVVLVEIDSNYSGEITNLTGGEVRGFPTLMVIKKGRRKFEYNGERKEEEMLKFVRKTFKKVGGRRKRRSRKKNRRTRRRRRRSRRRKTRRRSR